MWLQAHVEDRFVNLIVLFVILTSFLLSELRLFPRECEMHRLSDKSDPDYLPKFQKQYVSMGINMGGGGQGLVMGTDCY